MNLFTYDKFPSFYNMAMDEWLMGKGEFLRLYGWNVPTLSYGRNQKSSTLNINYCKTNKFDYIRRPSGGRAVFHEFELTYSFISFRNRFPDSLYESYKIISTPILNALNRIGVKAEFYRVKIKKNSKTSSCFDAPNMYEIGVNGKKIVGSAQWRKKDSILQHGSIIFDWNEEHWIKSQSFDNFDLVKRTLKDSMTTIKENGVNITIDEFSVVLFEEFNKFFSLEKTDPFIEKDDSFFNLLSKYRNDSWNLIK